MKKIGKAIAKGRYLIFILALALLVPSAIGYLNTRVNYDILSYLPDSLETVSGQDIMVDEFGRGAFSMVIVENMDNKDVVALKEKLLDLIDVEVDSLRIYYLGNRYASKVEHFGVDRGFAVDQPLIL